jgi:hypothetical protein
MIVTMEEFDLKPNQRTQKPTGSQDIPQDAHLHTPSIGARHILKRG